MKRYVILHGHFYQPPREDPWSGRIEYQESARPFCNWNKRIASESYAASAWSRVLDENGFITSIVNNYLTLSWNFGPTLLSWIEQETPNLYQRLLEADRESLRTLGHGNAVAQSFNHTILPLNTPEDAELQIDWGLKDFEHRFGRRAEGMWMPECAVNHAVTDILIARKLKFVILSPWQAEAVRKTGGKWKALGDLPAPSNRPFLIKRPQGQIAAFFYEPQLASAVSFGHLLHSREGFEAALRDALDASGGPMVNIATDGEIYGHHEPFGDMCLAALTEHLKDNSDLVFTNYAAYLDENPPKEEVRLSMGDDGLGSSWSCAHGVGRWMRDCGCSTGAQEGWNQAWRQPLREAFDKLKERADPLWTHTVSSLTGQSPRTVLTEYGAVLSGKQNPEEFALARLNNSGKESRDISRLLCALEGAKFLQFMYTSCGWFFGELSGIEPVQNMRYACRAAELLDPDMKLGLRKNLEESLEKARSNIPEAGSGAEIFKTMAEPSCKPEILAGAELFWRAHYKLSGQEEALQSDYETLELVCHTRPDHKESIEGKLSFIRKSTREKYVLPFKARTDGPAFCPELSIRDASGWQRISADTMPRELRRQIREKILHHSERKLMQFIGTEAPSFLKGLKMVEDLGVSLGQSGRQTLGLSLYYGAMHQLEKLNLRPPSQWPEVLSSLDEILSFQNMEEASEGRELIARRVGNMVSNIAENLQEDTLAETLEQLIRFISILHRHGYKPLKPFIQNRVYSLLEQRFNAEVPDRLSSSISDADLLNLAWMMNINPRKFSGQP